MKRRTAVILLNIRSSENAGSICRTAECAGVSEMYCVGTTPTHKDRFGRENKKFTKVSLGAENKLKIEHATSIEKVLFGLKKYNFEIIALEQGHNSVDYRDIKSESNFAIILGNEVDGIPLDVLSMADKVAEIKLVGEKESLNVSVAFGIAIFRFLKL